MHNGARRNKVSARERMRTASAFPAPSKHTGVDVVMQDALEKAQAPQKKQPSRKRKAQDVPAASVAQKKSLKPKKYPG